LETIKPPGGKEKIIIQHSIRCAVFVFDIITTLDDLVKLKLKREGGCNYVWKR
jgi:hypothetical protein